MLVRQVYASQLRPGTTEAEIKAIVDQAIEKNSVDGITGVVAFDDGRILQIFEGRVGDIDALYARILADPRHEGVVSLRYDEIFERHFHGWHMVRRPMTDLLLLVASLYN